MVTWMGQKYRHQVSKKERLWRIRSSEVNSRVIAQRMKDRIKMETAMRVAERERYDEEDWKERNRRFIDGLI